MNFKKFIALISAVVVIVSFSAIIAFATNIETESDNEIAIILERINNEYGTNIRVMSEEELKKYGLNSNDVSTAMATYENVDLEKTLRYIAEVKIPEFERTTQEAIAATESIGVGYIGGDYNFDYSIEPGLFKSEHPIMAYHNGNGQLQLAEMDLSKIEPYFANQTLEYYAYMNIHTADKELIPVILEARNRVVHDKSWVADCTDGWVTDGAGNIIEIVPHFHEVFPEDWEIPWYPPEYNPEGSPYNP